jgi:hypothetical protein
MLEQLKIAKEALTGVATVTFPQVEAGDQNHQIYQNHRISLISVSGNEEIAIGGTLHEYR